MRVQIDGGPSATAVIDATIGAVSSVNGQTGAITITAAELGADPAGTAAAAAAAAQAAAIDAAAADATAKVDAHIVATDPHGDRAYADSTFLPKAGGTLSGGLFADLGVRAAFLKTTSTTEHAVTIYQAGTSGASGVALNVISDKPTDSAMYLTGTESARGTLKITHLNPGPGATDDASAAALSIDLKRNGMGGTAAQGVVVLSTEGATTGNLALFRNNGRDDFVVKGAGLVGVRMDIGEAPEAALEVKQGDTTTVGLVVTGFAATTQPIFQAKTSAGTATLEVGSSGAIVHRGISFYTSSLQLGSTSSDMGGSGGPVISMKDATTAPTTNPTGGVIAYSQGGVFKTRSAAGVIFDTTRRTVTGAKGGNAALASLLTQLAATGLITDSSTA